MSLGEKLAKLRRENNYTQEQLAEVLNVSRQSISKWESDIAYPETDKLIKISNLFNCSLDYLLKDEVLNSNSEEKRNINPFKFHFTERKSTKNFKGLPIYHIGKNAKGVIAIGFNAKGIIAIGFKATGLISFGMLSIGIFSFGLLSIGLLTLGLFAIGLLACGCFSLGIVAIGAICLGIIAIGSIAIGNFSLGALAIGKYFAYGDNAKAMIAIGKTKATGNIIQKNIELTTEDIEIISNSLDSIVPKYFSWIKEIIKSLLK